MFLRNAVKHLPIIPVSFSRNFVVISDFCRIVFKCVEYSNHAFVENMYIKMAFSRLDKCVSWSEMKYWCRSTEECMGALKPIEIPSSLPSLPLPASDAKPTPTTSPSRPESMVAAAAQNSRASHLSRSGKLYRARSRLYRSRILQENIFCCGTVFSYFQWYFTNILMNEVLVNNL